MAQQEIDIGTGPGVGDGDPLRVAFDKINQNFAELYSGDDAGVTAGPVNSVAGKIGNVTLTVTDVVGAVSQGYVANQMQLQVAAAVQNGLDEILDSAPNALNTLRELAAALDDNPEFSIDIAAAIADKDTIASVDSKIAAVTALANSASDSVNASLSNINFLAMTTNQTVDGLTATMVTKADSDTVYTKAEIDALLQGISSTSTDNWGYVGADPEFDWGSVGGIIETSEDYGDI